MKKILLPITIAGVLMASGCATILNEDTQNLNVRTSNNSEITAIIDGKKIKTPGSMAVKRAKGDLVVFTTAKNCAGATQVESSVDSVFFLNLLSGGTFGSTTDYSSDDMWEYDTDVVVNCNN